MSIKIVSSRNKRGYVAVALKGDDVRIVAGYYVAPADSFSNVFTCEEALKLSDGLQEAVRMARRLESARGVGVQSRSQGESQ